jgi:ribokinase
MPIELAVATPSFLDLTFVGLESVPALGEERFAADLIRSPGGGAITAIGAARLGVATALAAPIGEDDAGEFVRKTLTSEGIAMVDRRCPHTPTTVVMPASGDRAMATVDAGVRASTADVAALAPRAVASSLDQLYCVPEGAYSYVTCGNDDARAFAGRPPADLARVRVLFVSDSEAKIVSGAAETETAAAQLAAVAQTVVVTLGARGAFSLSQGTRIDIPAIDAGTPVDTTGAGDLLAAAYIWADLRGASPRECLHWGVIYAGLSIARPTAVGGAVARERLLEEGARYGLAPPDLAGTA